MRDGLLRPGYVRHYTSGPIHARIMCRGDSHYRVEVTSFAKSKCGRKVYTADLSSYVHCVHAVKLFLVHGNVTVWVDSPLPGVAGVA